MEILAFEAGRGVGHIHDHVSFRAIVGGLAVIKAFGNREGQTGNDSSWLGASETPALN